MDDKIDLLTNKILKYYEIFDSKISSLELDKVEPFEYFFNSFLEIYLDVVQEEHKITKKHDMNYYLSSIEFKIFGKLIQELNNSINRNTKSIERFFPYSDITSINFKKADGFNNYMKNNILNDLLGPEFKQLLIFFEDPILYNYKNKSDFRFNLFIDFDSGITRFNFVLIRTTEIMSKIKKIFYSTYENKMFDTIPIISKIISHYGLNNDIVSQSIDKANALFFTKTKIKEETTIIPYEEKTDIVFDPKKFTENVEKELKKISDLILSNKNISPDDYVRNILDKPEYKNNIPRLAFDHPAIYKIIKEKGLESFLMGKITDDEYRKIEEITKEYEKPILLMNQKFKIDPIKMALNIANKTEHKQRKKFK